MFKKGDRVRVVRDGAGAGKAAMKGDTGTVMENGSHPFIMMDREDVAWTSFNNPYIPKDRGEIFLSYQLEAIAEDTPNVAPDTIDGLKKERDDLRDALEHLLDGVHGHIELMNPYGFARARAILAKYPKG